ncbi:ABC transporter ATP-binding protein [bacterium]|nr:MAG: ABC transporter ATP-binding protein [bacterium]
MGTTGKIIELTRPYWPRVFLGIILGLIVSGLTGAIAWFVKPVLDVILVDKRYEYLAFFPLGVIILFSMKGALQFGYAYLMKSSAMKLIRDTQNRLHNHILYLPVGYFDQESSGIIISRVMNDVRVLSTLFTEVIRTAIIQIPTVLVLLGVAFYRKWDLTLLTLMLFPFIAYSTKKLGKRVKKKSFEAQRKLSFLTHKLSETIMGSKIIKVFNRGPYRDEKFRGENQRVYRENMKVVRLKETTKLLIDVVTGIGIGLVVWYGSRQVIKGVMTPGDFASVIAAIYMVFVPIKKVGESYNILQEIKAALARVEKLLHMKTEDSGTREIKTLTKEIRYENISFSYRDDTDVLRDINLTIHAGEIVAIVGPSGVGKTTLVDLIPKFYLPTSGRITIDGVDTKEIDLHSLRNLIGIVSQDIVLFDDTVRENIAFGNKNAIFHEIEMAAEMAYASEFIEKLPEGYETVIGERGMNLSGGQRQRLAIARALLKNPPLLILDEATSSLDTVSESLVQKALAGLMKNRTTIVIAHRLSTIKNAHRIVVLESGRISNIGTHEELLVSSDTYSKLCSMVNQH